MARSFPTLYEKQVSIPEDGAPHRALRAIQRCRRAFFEPHDVRTDRVPGEADPLKDGVARVADLKPKAPTYRFARGNNLYPDKDNPLTPRVPEVLGGKLEIKPIELPLEAWYPALRPWVLEEETAAAQRKIVETAAVLKKFQEEFATAKGPPY